MKLVIVSAVGTSLLRNFISSQRFQDTIKKFNMFDWDKLAVDDPRNAYPDGEVCRAGKDAELLNALRSFVLENPSRAMAEVNGVESALRVLGASRGDTEVMLFASQTCNSILCASIARDALKALGYSNVEIIEVKALRSVDEFDQGLVELIDKVIERVVDYVRRGYSVAVSATPGFKAETAFLTIVAMLLGAPSIYIHESFREPVDLPPLPIRLDFDRIADALNIFRSNPCIDKGLAINILGNKLKQYIELQILKEKPGGLVCIRPWITKLLEITKALTY
ncbi:MAG: putative CRISPR-associated protein [Ignisphaera sp.]|nr:putative CRISPR-associated protein [Ignisphaera sp.]